MHALSRARPAGRGHEPGSSASRGEHAAYGAYWIGQNLLLMVVTTYLAVYYTTVLAIPPTIVGGIFVIARAWDAVLDPLLATLIDRHPARTRYKPWVLAAVASVPLITIACFSFQGALLGSDLLLRSSYALITYVAWGTAFSLSDAPAYALATTIAPAPSERGALLTSNQATSMLGILLGLVALPALVSATSDWPLSVAVLAALAVATMLPIVAVRERRRGGDAPPAPRRQSWSRLLRSPTVRTAVVLNLIGNGTDFALTLFPFAATEMFGTSNLASVLVLLRVVPAIAVSLLGVRLIRRVGKARLLFFSYAAGAVTAVAAFALGRESLGVFLMLWTLRSVVTAPQFFMTSVLLSDAIENMRERYGRGYEAPAFALQTLSSKIALAASGSIPLWLIGFAGYHESTGGAAISQPATALDALWAAFLLGPALGAAGCAAVVWRNRRLIELPSPAAEPSEEFQLSRSES